MGAAGWGYWKGLTQTRSTQGHRQTGSQRGANLWRLGEHPGIFTTEQGSEVAQKALLFGDDIPAIATIGFVFFVAPIATIGFVSLS
jgi:hypothetical protein